MTAYARHFIVIDDNKLDCFIAEKMILKSGLSNRINLFMDGREALDFIKADTPPENGSKVIIIVDIQMPLINGFEFVETFETLPPDIRQHYVIFMLSSSNNENDMNRVRNFSSVKYLLNKPLTKKCLHSLVELLNKES
jgi:CheY-like chemotaxis protein